MLVSLLRRILIFLSTLSLTGTALFLVHTVHIGGVPSWKMGLAMAAALLVLVPSWIGIVKTDDYLIPSHARWFFISTATVAGLCGAALLAFFTIANYPQPYFIYFGAAPAGLAVLYIAMARFWIRESSSFPLSYRPEKSPLLHGVIPSVLSVPVLGISCCLLALVVKEADFGAAGKQAEERPRHDETASGVALREQRAEETFKLAKARKAGNHYRQSFELFKKAAALGHVPAHHELALLYSEDGYLQNLPLALEHFEKAHAAGHLEATYRLGKIYRHGEFGVAVDFAKARSYLTTAAERGHPKAQLELAHLFNKGQGVEKDPEIAFHWLLKAAEQGNPTAQNDLGIFYLNGIGVEADQAESLRWIAKAADQGVSVAQFNFGTALYTGNMIPQDYERAFGYFSELAAKNIPYGFRMTGIQYLLGQGVERDPKAAVEAFRQGALRNDEASLFHLGKCYLEGVGTEADSSVALRHLKKAASLGHGEAQFLLGQILLKGDIILRDKARAIEYLRAAAANGVAEAEQTLSELEETSLSEEKPQGDERLAADQPDLH